MKSQDTELFTAFTENRLLASGPLPEVATQVKKQLDRDGTQSILIFSDHSGKTIDLNLQGTLSAVLKRLAPPAAVEESTKPGPGRPKLGVVSREVTLLPQHWEWLNSQQGGASVTLRKLVEDAKKKYAGRDLARNAQNASYKFMSVLAGDRPGYEEAIRALFASNEEGFKQHMSTWPKDIRAHAKKLAQNAFT